METILREAGYDAHVAILHRARNAHRRSKKKIITAGPLVPGFLLVCFNDDEEPRWLDLMRFRQVHGVIGHDGTPLPLTQEAADWFFRSSSRPFRYRNSQHRRNYGRAYPAEIVNGPFGPAEGEPPRKVRVIEYTGEEAKRRFMKGEVFEMYELFKPQKAA